MAVAPEPTDSRRALLRRDEFLAQVPSWYRGEVHFEWCHLAYHMPESSWMGGNPVIRWLRTTHTRHHDPRRMLRKNFNVTFPIFDALMGTLEK